MGIGHMGNGAQWAIEYKGLGHMGNGVKGYGPIDNGTRGQLGTRAWDTWTMGYRPSNVSECQKDVKCQKIKHLDYGGGSQKKDIDTMRFTHIDVNFNITYDSH